MQNLMTVADVEKWIKDIEAKEGDWEVTHSMHDSLNEAVLEAIAEGRTDNPQALAKAAIRAEELGFPRWYA